MTTTVTYTEQTRLAEAARAVVERARAQLPLGEAIDHLAAVLTAADRELCRECLHPTASGSIHAACVRERELAVLFLRRHGAFVLANRIAADHHVLLHDGIVAGRGKPHSASTPPDDDHKR